MSRREYPRLEGNVPSRHPERASFDVESVHAILDEGLVGHVGFIVDGRPRVLPMLYLREGDSLFLHGSTGARLSRMAARAKVPVSFEVTLYDALVLARSVFNHSINYRSVVASGEVTLVGDTEQKGRLLGALVERIVPGRGADARGPNDIELRQTALLELPLEEVSAKVRSGDPKDNEEDLARNCWAGTVPLVAHYSAPEPSADLAAGISLPSYLTDLAASPGRG